MYISEFVCGILATIGIEVFIIVVAGIVSAVRGKKKNDKSA